MNYEQTFLQSFKRVSTLDPAGDLFFRRFYENFSVSPEVGEKLKGVDMAKQYGARKRSLLLMLEFFISKQANEALAQIAHRHNRRGLDIRPHLYDPWQEALVETVKELDPEQDRGVLLAWKIVLSVGITYMKDMHDRCDS